MIKLTIDQESLLSGAVYDAQRRLEQFTLASQAAAQGRTFVAAGDQRVLGKERCKITLQGAAVYSATSCDKRSPGAANALMRQPRLRLMDRAGHPGSGAISRRREICAEFQEAWAVAPMHLLRSPRPTNLNRSFMIHLTILFKDGSDPLQFETSVEQHAQMVQDTWETDAAVRAVIRQEVAFTIS
jgi:hypothetical protein